MATQATTEERLEIVEKAVRDLQSLVGSRKSKRNWLDNVIGSMDAFPEFEKVVEYGREFRESDRPGEADPS